MIAFVLILGVLYLLATFYVVVMLHYSRVAWRWYSKILIYTTYAIAWPVILTWIFARADGERRYTEMELAKLANRARKARYN